MKLRMHIYYSDEPNEMFIAVYPIMKKGTVFLINRLGESIPTNEKVINELVDEGTLTYIGELY